MALEVVHTERSYIVVDSENWQQPNLVRITRQLQAKLANTRVARDAKLGALITEETVELLLTLAEDSESWAQDNNSYSEETVQARTLVTKIREALAQDRRGISEPQD